MAAVLLGLLAVVALTSSRERPRVSGGADPGAVAELRDVFLTVGATLYVVAIIATVWMLWKFRQGGRGSGPRSGIGSLFVFLILSAGIYWGIHHRPPPTQPALNEIPLGPGQPQLQPPPAQPSATKPIPPAQFRWEIAAGLLIAIVLAIVAVVVSLRRRRPEDSELDPLERRDRVAAELASIVDGTIDDLRREQDPRRAPGAPEACG